MSIALRGLGRVHRGVPVAVASVVLLAGLLVVTCWMSFDAAATLRLQQQSQIRSLNAQLMADRARIAALQIVRGERGYVVTGKDAYLDAFVEGSTDLQRAIAAIGEPAASEPDAASPRRELQEQSRQFEAIAAQIVATRRVGDAAAAVALIDSGQERASLQALDATLEQVSARERVLLTRQTALTRKAAGRQQSALLLAAILGFAMTAVALLAVMLLRRALAREALLRAELRRREATDDLTGLASRREALAALDRAVATAQRDGRPLAFATLDIDHFRRINDTYGHSAGDLVIREVAALAARTVRAGDLVGRLGSEEFAIVLPGANEQEAVQVCERLRAAVHRHPVRLADGRSVRVSVSTGLGHFRRHENAGTLIGRAEAALHEAKRGGRDRVKRAA